MTFRFHAAPRAGEWMNDPNGLAFYDGRFRLWAQHSNAAPDYRRIGWGRWSSDDLLEWDWDGVAIAAGDTISAYSGSISRADGEDLDVWLTLNDHDGGWQTQHRGTGTPLVPGKSVGPQGRDCRDPFVFLCAATGDWRMIVAEPCGWSTWRDDPPSRLVVWRSNDRMAWTAAGAIGPWHPPGVMWEVPVLVDFGDMHALVLSLVDRRTDGARCSVRYWLGRFDGSGFTRDAAFPIDGVLFDNGPDFYAVTPNLATGWPDARRLMIGWASSWQTARSMPWPGDARGGPATLPRIISCVDGRMRQAPLDAAMALGTTMRRWEPGVRLGFDIRGDEASLSVTIDADGQVVAERAGREVELDWRSAPFSLAQATDIAIFIDAGLVELFFLHEGHTLTAFVPGAVEVS